MNSIEYKRNAIRTLPDLGSYKLNISHMIMGICSELNELEDAIKKNDKVNILEELVDMQWYMASYSEIRGNASFVVSFINIQNEYPTTISWFIHRVRKTLGLRPTKNLKNLYYHVSLLTDLLKKHVAYDKEIDELDEIFLLQRIQQNISEILNFYKLDIHQGLENNINKLKVRFKHKFTTEEANNRKLDIERIELEK